MSVVIAVLPRGKILGSIACCLAALAALAPAGATQISKADSIRKYRFLAKSARDNKEYDAALHYYREHLRYEWEPRRARRSHFEIGKILYYQKKDRRGAKQACLRALALDSLYVNPNLMLYALYKDASPDSAARCLERVLAARPGDLRRRRELADLYRLHERPRAAIAHYTRLVEAGAGGEELLEVLAVLHEDLGQRRQALRWRRRLLEAQKRAARSARRRIATLERMVDLQVEVGVKEELFETLIQLAQLDSANRYAHYSRLAHLAENRGDEAMRRRGLEGMVRADPADLESVALLAEGYLGEGKVAEAEQWIERGLRVEARCAHLLVLRGDALARRGARDEAIEAFEAAKADPDWARIAQQRIWQLRPPQTEEEKLEKAFFGGEERARP